MDNQPIQPPIISTPPPPPVPPVIPQPPKKKSFAWLIILVVLLLLASTGVLAYQYYQLKTQTVNPVPSPSLAPTPTPTLLVSPQPSAETADPTADWQTYTNNVYKYTLRIPSNWVNYSTNDFSVQELTSEENSLYLGPKETNKKPPQLMQLTAYKINDFHEQEMFSQCTLENIKIGPAQIPATRKTCTGMESNGFTTITTNQYVFIIDELKGTVEDHQIFDLILSTFKFLDGAKPMI